MNLLAIETSTPIASVALSMQGNIASCTENIEKQHATIILPMIDNLLNTAGISINMLDGIVFGQGPGSFTGLRIACAVAKGLAYAHDLPVFPVSGLTSIVFDANPEKHAVLAMIDARMQEVYWTFATSLNDNNIEKLNRIADIKFKTNRPIILAGVIDNITTIDNLSIKIINKLTIVPSATTMLSIVLNGKIKAVSADEAAPVYVRNKVA